MILSHKHKFIFIKTRKTGGTSVECVLSEICGPRDIITPISDADELLRKASPQNYKFRGIKTFYNHMPAAEVIELCGREVWKDYFTFTVERDPFEKLISLYYYLINSGLPETTIGQFIRAGRMKMIKDWNHYTINGQVAVDFIMRQEKLCDHFGYVRQRIGVDMRELPRAKSNFRQDRRPAKELLTDNEIKEVAEYFADEIDFFRINI